MSEENIEVNKPSRQEIVEMIDEMINNIERLPPGAMLQPINHYDYCSLLILLSVFLKSELPS